jgi:hypothetical protein
MPLSQDDPALDYDGSWADASKDWPLISFPTPEAAKIAYIIAWRNAKVPYGSYVLVDKELRLQTLDLKKLVEEQLLYQKSRINNDSLSLEEKLATLRQSGWTVACHNDYRQNGISMTFWLFTHPNYMPAKGEGKSDNEAIDIVLSIVAKTASNPCRD